MGSWMHFNLCQCLYDKDYFSYQILQQICYEKHPWSYWQEQLMYDQAGHTIIVMSMLTVQGRNTLWPATAPNATTSTAIASIQDQLYTRAWNHYNTLWPWAHNESGFFSLTMLMKTENVLENSDTNNWNNEFDVLFILV